jgi:ABC-type transport system involved in cytochrome bd biosynthesis fused ATPase/permease subunit
LTQYVADGNEFLGSFLFFMLEAMIIPLINLVLKKYYSVIGNIIGIFVYFIVFIPLSMLFGGA